MSEKNDTIAGESPSPDAAGEKWLFRLYVTDHTPKCISALENLKRFCEEHLAGKYEIELVDLLEKPWLAKDDQIIAIPTLIRKLPEPVRKLIGTLNDTERLLVGLELTSK